MSIGLLCLNVRFVTLFETDACKTGHGGIL